jgi:hypothetical protein
MNCWGFSEEWRSPAALRAGLRTPFANRPSKPLQI